MVFLLPHEHCLAARDGVGMVFSLLLADFDSCGHVWLLHRDTLTRLVLLDTVLDAGLVAVVFFVFPPKPLNLLCEQGPNAAWAFPRSLSGASGGCR